MITPILRLIVPIYLYFYLRILFGIYFDLKTNFTLIRRHINNYVIKYKLVFILRNNKVLHKDKHFIYTHIIFVYVELVSSNGHKMKINFVCSMWRGKFYYSNTYNWQIFTDLWFECSKYSPAFSTDNYHLVFCFLF